MSNQANTLRFIYNGSTLRASPSSTFSRLIPELEKTTTATVTGPKDQSVTRSTTTSGTVMTTPSSQQ
jgi:hypothetical protein